MAKYFQPHAYGVISQPVSHLTQGQRAAARLIDEIEFGESDEEDEANRRKARPSSSSFANTIRRHNGNSWATRNHLDTPRRGDAHESRLTAMKPGASSFKPQNTLNKPLPGRTVAQPKRGRVDEQTEGSEQSQKRQRTETRDEQKTHSIVSTAMEVFSNFTTTSFSRSTGGYFGGGAKKQRERIKRPEGEPPAINLTAGLAEITEENFASNGRPGGCATKRQHQEQQESEDELAGGTTIRSRPVLKRKNAIILRLSVKFFESPDYFMKDDYMELIWDDDEDFFGLFHRGSQEMSRGRHVAIVLEPDDIQEFRMSTTQGLVCIRLENREQLFVEFTCPEHSKACYERLIRHSNDIGLVTESHTNLSKLLDSFRGSNQSGAQLRTTNMLDQNIRQRAETGQSRTVASYQEQDERSNITRKPPLRIRGESALLANNGRGSVMQAASQVPRAIARPVDREGSQERSQHFEQSNSQPRGSAAEALRQRRLQRDQVTLEGHRAPSYHQSERARSASPRDNTASDSRHAPYRPAGLQSLEVAEANLLRSRSTRALKPMVVREVTPPRKPRWTRIHRPTPWSEPVVYPSHGARRVTVEFKDLERLDEGEFLNDTLISFALRRIEDSIAAKARAKVHFFNSYFYSSLSSNKGIKGFNYNAVKRWTKNTDLLSTDFVVVPINYDLHWFAAIICNLTALKTDVSVSSPMLLDDVVQSAERKFDDLTLMEQQASAEVSDSQEPPSPDAAGSAATRSPEQSSKGRRPPVLRKYDPNTPAVITLDSFGTSHTTEIAVLKDYITAEVYDKQELEITRSAIQGVTAKGLVEQDNFCDCGLFVIGYLEAFARDPRDFTTKVLSRTLDPSIDFADFDPSRKRAEIRNDLRTLYAQQEAERAAQKEERAESQRRKLEAERIDHSSNHLDV